jgi:integrase
MARLPGYITRYEGKRVVTYEARINYVTSDGRRLQPKRRSKTLDAAKEWHSTATGELAAGTHTAPSDVTVKEAVEAWLTAKSARVKPTTADAYTAALAPVVDRYGDAKVQSLTKLDVEVLVTELRTGTTDRGVWKRTSINPMLARWKTVWRDLHAQGVLARNVVALVEPLRKPSGEPAMKVDDSLSETEVEQLTAAHAEGADEYARRRELFRALGAVGTPPR